jgi:hypothetical protein
MQFNFSNSKLLFVLEVVLFLLGLGILYIIFL